MYMSLQVALAQGGEPWECHHSHPHHIQQKLVVELSW